MAVCVAAMWAWALIHYHRQERLIPSVTVLDFLLRKWLSDPTEFFRKQIEIALFIQLGLQRDKWTPVLTDEEIKKIKTTALRKKSGETFDISAALFVAFHSKSVFPEAELARMLSAANKSHMVHRPHRDPIDEMLKQMGAVGARYRKPLKRKSLRTIVAVRDPS